MVEDEYVVMFRDVLCCDGLEVETRSGDMD